MSGVPRPALVPDPAARFNVLVLHGEIAGVLPAAAAATDRVSNEIAVDELNAEEWTYIALGHYHVYRSVAPRAYYSGSIEYTSANVWESCSRSGAVGFRARESLSTIS